MSSFSWMDFTDWLLHHFLVYAISSRPLLLLLCGLLSRFTLEFVKLAAEHDVIIFCLPPHTAADTQPLDTSCFKNYWADVCLFANQNKIITKFHFSELFAK